MSSLFIHYDVSISDEAITLEDGKSFKRTAVVEKWKGATKLSSFKLGVPEKESIYASIFKGESLDLDHCYVKDFSLDDYRKMHNLPEDTIIELNSFSADHAFFDSQFGTNFSYSNFAGRVGSFAYAIFNQGKVNFGHSHCSTSLNFNRAEFHVEEVSFRFAEFEKGDVRFSSCIFDCEDILFVNTNFGEGNVSFRQSDFRESNCNFQYSRFNNGNVTFDKAMFHGKVLDFRKMEFGNGKAEFRRVHFGDGDINFSDSEFGVGKVSFRSSIFGRGEKKFEDIDFGESETSFDGVIIEGGLFSMKRTTFDHLSFQDARLGGHCDFRISKGNVLDMSYCIVRDVVDLQAGETKVDLKTWKIEGLKNMGKLFLLWRENKAYRLIASQEGTTDFSKANQFNLLKESFHQNGMYDSEDEAYVAFKRAEMRSKLKRAKLSGQPYSSIGKFQYYFQWLIFDKAGLFATSPIRVFTTMVIVLTFFSILYIVLPFIAHAGIISSVGDPDNLNIVEKSFYHSAITFFTIGYGDYYPSGHIRWLSAVEGWTGVFIMSYFTVAFVRKILR